VTRLSLADCTVTTWTPDGVRLTSMIRRRPAAMEDRFTASEVVAELPVVYER